MHRQFVRIKIPTLDLGRAFQILEESNSSPTGCVVDYSICQNTLENVFLNFAKLQEDIQQDKAEKRCLVERRKEENENNNGSEGESEIENKNE